MSKMREWALVGFIAVFGLCSMASNCDFDFESDDDGFSFDFDDDDGFDLGDWFD